MKYEILMNIGYDVVVLDFISMYTENISNNKYHIIW
jgi:hypothetical protein